MSEELREQIAAALHGQLGSVVELDVCESAADALLSGPLAPLLAAQAAVERVEALAEELEHGESVLDWMTVRDRIRAALDGTT